MRNPVDLTATASWIWYASRFCDARSFSCCQAEEHSACLFPRSLVQSLDCTTSAGGSYYMCLGIPAKHMFAVCRMSDGHPIWMSLELYAG